MLSRLLISYGSAQIFKDFEEGNYGVSTKSRDRIN